MPTPMAKIPALEYLRSRILLARDERDIIRREISDLEAIVELGKKETSQFHEQLEQDEKTLSYYRALLAPIRLLPPEVLGEIFIHFKSSHPSHPSKSLRDVMRLSLVCNTWWGVLLNTPELWTAIFIPWPPDAQFTSLLQLQLTRSSSLPLELTSLGFHTPPQNIFDILHPSSHRFERLEIALPRNLPLLNGPNTLDSLKEICIWFNSPQDEEPLHMVPITAPKLRFVVLRNSQYRWVHGHLGLPWTQLTHLEFGGSWFDQDVLAILHECSNLFALTTYFHSANARSYGATGDFIPSHRVVLPLLHTWKNNQGTGQIFIDLSLETLTLPSLHTLHIESPPLPKLLSLVERSSCALECLQIKAYSQMSEKTQAQLVESLPSLRTFTHVVIGHPPDYERSGVYPRVAERLAARRLGQDRFC